MMKTFLLEILPFLSSLLIAMYGFILRLLRSTQLIQVQPSSGVLLPPSAAGSLGDEAMVVAAIEYLKLEEIDTIKLISYDSKKEYPVSGIESFDMGNYLIGNFSIKSFKELIRFVFFVSRFERFYCLGADVMDGYYSDYLTFKRWKLLEISDRIGVQSKALGFSCNRQPTEMSIETMKNLPLTVQLCARDAVSQSRLEQSINRPVKLVADLAFLLQPDWDSPKVLDVYKWIELQKQENRIIIGINCSNKLVESIENKTESDLLKAYIKFMSLLFSEQKKISFLLLPHDFRNVKEKFSDDRLCQLILEGLPVEIKSYCTKIPNPCRAAEIKAMVAKVDMVVSGRMHLAIATLGQAVPVFCITYQGKFEGLFQHFGLKDMTIEPTDLLNSDPSIFANALGSLIENREALHQQIQKKLPEVKELAKSNFM